MKTVLFFILVSISLSACVATGPTPTITVTPAAQEDGPAATFAATSTSPAAPSPAVAEETPAPRLDLEPRIEDGVEITVADGVTLVGTLYAPAQSGVPLPGVILLHMLGSDRASWHEFGVRLALEGYTALAFDMRGHGDTGGGRDFQKTIQDLEGVWDYFAGRPEVDEDSIAIVGASIGANLALVTASTLPSVDTVVLLSPGLQYRGVTTDDAILEYGDRPLMIVASREDTYAAQSSQQLEGLARGEVELLMFGGAGHGTNMLASKPELAGMVVDWLDRHID